MRGTYDLDEMQWFPGDDEKDYTIVETRIGSVSARSEEEAIEIYASDPEAFMESVVNITAQEV